MRYHNFCEDSQTGQQPKQQGNQDQQTRPKPNQPSQSPSKLPWQDNNRDLVEEEEGILEEEGPKTIRTRPKMLQQSKTTTT